MPYVYDDPIMFGQNPFARPANQRPVPVQSNGMTRPMPVRPGSGQAVNTQGQSVNGVPIGPGGRPSVDILADQYVAPPLVSGDDLILTDTTESTQLQQQLQAIADREKEGQQLTTVTTDDTAPEAGGSASPMFGTGGFEFIGLVAIGALIYYMARA
ncbi:MAG: hypothetical protein NWE76_08475 [Candidatus Bathyarchaeota archaeon]|nr:hypothetical protein [Candidatus Bathyarchaeota archaeon]